MTSYYTLQPTTHHRIVLNYGSHDLFYEYPNFFTVLHQILNWLLVDASIHQECSSFPLWSDHNHPVPWSSPHIFFHQFWIIIGQTIPPPKFTYQWTINLTHGRKIDWSSCLWLNCVLTYKGPPFSGLWPIGLPSWALNSEWFVAH